jgi:hypothetical protein
MLLLAVATIVATMMTVSASPALATANPPSCESGQVLQAPG